jgi:aprataxin
MSRFQTCIYYLRSLDALCPDILLQRDIPLVLGRGPLTRIKDSKLSRHQVRITWSDKGIFVKQLASNPSYLNTRPLAKDEKAELAENSILHLVSNRFPFKLILKTDYIALPTHKLDAKVDAPEVNTNSAAAGCVNKNPANTSHWNFGLLQSMNNPQLKVLEKSDHIVIKDKFPKAEHHFLILPLERIQNCASLTADHVPLLRNMVKTGWELADKYPHSRFRLGFHAIPSMSQVHLHVISQDFNSDKLKTKKHWNSFTTDYFINPEIIIDKLKTKGSYVPMSKAEGDELLKKDLECHICQHKPKNIPDLKNHLQSHL